MTMALNQFCRLFPRSWVKTEGVQLHDRGQCRATNTLCHVSPDCLTVKEKLCLVSSQKCCINQSAFQCTLAFSRNLILDSKEQGEKMPLPNSFHYNRLANGFSRISMYPASRNCRHSFTTFEAGFGGYSHNRRWLHVQHKLHYCTPSTRGTQGDSDFMTLGKEIIDAAKKIDVMAGTVPLPNVVQLLQDLHTLGFKVEQVVNLLSPRVWLLQDPKAVTELAETLQTHGLNQDVVLHILENLPLEKGNSSVQCIKDLFIDSLQGLRAMGFTEKDLQLFLMQEPGIVFIGSKACHSVLGNLKGLFTKADALSLIKKCPNVLSEPWDEIREKFDYAFFAMGYQQPAILKSHLFIHSIEHIEDRHLFLVRAGLFVPVKQKDDPKLNPNPPLKDVVDTLDHTFVKMYGGMSVEEYKAYLSMREIERENEDLMSDEDESEDESDEERFREESKKKQRKKSKSKRK